MLTENIWKHCCVDGIDSLELKLKVHDTEVVAKSSSTKKMFSEILQNSQENTCTTVSLFLIKLPATLLKKRLWYRYFPVNFAKFLRTPFLTEPLRWLLLKLKVHDSKLFSNFFYIINARCLPLLINSSTVKYSC